MTDHGAVGNVLFMSNANSANTFFDRNFHYPITTIPGHQFYLLYPNRGLVQRSCSTADQMFDAADALCSEHGVIACAFDDLYDVVSMIVCDDNYVPRRIGYVRKTPFGNDIHLF